MGEIDVLIVEDDPMVAEINRRYVEDVGGFNVVAVTQTGGEALSLARRLHPQLIILDIYLPDLSGIETLQEIRRLGLPVDVILVTAARDVETIQNVLRYGVVDYIVKPFRYGRMKGALESYRRLVKQLKTKNTLSQDEIDRLTSGAHGSPMTLPKGLNEVTLKQVVMLLMKEKRAVSAEEVAAGTGLSRVTARRYLDYLAKTGQARIQAQYGSVGRPTNRYSLLW